MRHFTATEAKNRFGELLDEAMTEPVVIVKNGRDIAVLISKSEFDRRNTGSGKREMVRKYHEESMVEFEELYQELAK
ncbi:MAG: type II toxin-antitoxin system Phd/YefM family antitoxin [Nitratireductor sp.]